MEPGVNRLRPDRSRGRRRMPNTSTNPEPGDPDGFMDEAEEWLRLTPAERLLATTALWEAYLALGGSLDPEPDPQSPFYFPEPPGSRPTDRRPGGDHLRRRRV